MDDDLMARRLRPPSETPLSQNGISAFDSEQAQAPWVSENDIRAEVPWDRPADEPWPPADELVGEQAWPPVPTTPAAVTPSGNERSVHATDSFRDPGAPGVDPGRAPSGDDSFNPTTPPTGNEPPADASTQVANRPTTWDDMPAPWDAPAERKAGPSAPPTPAARWDAPSASETAVGSDTPVAGSVTPALSWDTPVAAWNTPVATWHTPAASWDTPDDLWDTADSLWQDVPADASFAPSAAAAVAAPVESVPPMAEPPAAVAEPIAEPVQPEHPVQPVEPVAMHEPMTVAEAESEPGGDAPDAFLASVPWDDVEPVNFEGGWADVAPIDDRTTDMFAGFADDQDRPDPTVDAITRSEPTPETQPIIATDSEAQPGAVAGTNDGMDLAQVDEAGADPPPWAMHAAADPDDALAPVLADVEQPTLPPWAGWTDAAIAGPAVGVAAVRPADAWAELGPTPPDDLFDEPVVDDAVPVSEPVVEQEYATPDAWAAETPLTSDHEPPADDDGADQRQPTSELEPAAETELTFEHEPVARTESISAQEATTEQPVAAPPVVTSTDVVAPAVFPVIVNGQPVVLRIEVAIVDGNAIVRAVPSGPVVNASLDPEALSTPRTPEFEPRSHLNGNATPAASVPEATQTAAPWLLPMPAEPAVDHEPAASRSSDWPPVDLQPAAADPWAALEPMPTSDQRWATNESMSQWSANIAAVDPLAALPAAPAMAEGTQVRRDDRPAAAVAATFPQPAAMAAVAATPGATTQSDLWFVSSEPPPVSTVDGTQQVPREPSPAMTVGLTLVMAVVVIALVIAFLWLMTSMPIFR